MKVKVKYKDCNKLNSSHNIIIKFIKHLQSKFPLKNDVSIVFLGEKLDGMTTGSRTDNSELRILVQNRIIRDVLRTLAHEWVHEYQIDVLNRDKGPDIGGENEDEANAYSGRLVKQFEKRNPYKKEDDYKSLE
jgi:hypothetical protein